MDQQMLAPISIIVPGRNPRKYFDPAEMEELTASVRAQGVLQSLLVRPVDDGKLEVVAGERRLRAAKAAQLSEIPCLVREMTDAEVDAAALVENIQRASMSPTEEAEAAAKVLGFCAGNREETAGRLGWSRTTLDKRLGLMNCSESVRNALNERKIALGHAELLAATTRDKQDEVLEKMLKAPALPTVPQLKSMLEQKAHSLDAAIFDKDQCAGCPHNAATQQALFSEAISGSKCTNGACYQKKTDEVLAGKVESLKDDFPTVRLVSAGENFTILKLVADGNTGVGTDQAEQCKACANFGAAVSNIPGSVGNIYRNQCFDPACNARKVAARIKAEKEAQQTAPTSGKPSTNNAASGKSQKEQPKAAKGKPGKVADSQRVKDYRLKVWRKVFKIEAQDPKCNTVLLLALALTGKLSKVGNQMLSKALGALTGGSEGMRIDVSATAAELAALDADTQSRMVVGIPASCCDGLDEVDIKSLLKYLQADLGKHWVLNADYLELLTKSEIEVVAKEIGLKTFMGDQFAKAMSGKKDEIIKALLAVEGFTYKGQVPGHLHYDR